MAETKIVEDSMSDFPAPDTKRGYNRFLLLVAGLGGLLYGVDVGIIGGALPYLQATSKLTAGELSTVVAAVLLGSVISTLFAGLLAMAVYVVSINALLWRRLYQLAETKYALA